MFLTKCVMSRTSKNMKKQPVKQVFIKKKKKKTTYKKQVSFNFQTAET